MADNMPPSFTDGEFGYVPSVMLGGPIDGKRYKMPVLSGGGIPHGFGHPVQQPHETSPVAYYARASDTLVGGYFVYFCRGMREPGGRRVLANTPVINESTCEGYGTQSQSTIADTKESA